MPQTSASTEAVLLSIKFNDKIVSKFTSCLMYDGKRSTAEKIVYEAIDKIKSKNNV